MPLPNIFKMGPSEVGGNDRIESTREMGIAAITTPNTIPVQVDPKKEVVAY